MRVECKNCGCRIGTMSAFDGPGWSLRLVCGALVSYLAAHGARSSVQQLGSGWLSLLLLLVGLVVGLGALFWAFCPGFFFWWEHRKTPCPECGKRRWTWGFTEGWH